MKPTDPLTVEEVKEAADIFFPLYTEVAKRLPLNAKVEDTLKIMESVCKLAHKQRATNDEDKVGPFGFNKNGQDSNRKEESEAE